MIFLPDNLKILKMEHNVMCRILGHSYKRWSGGLFFCSRCGHVPEFHNRYLNIKPPKKKK
nr:MAG TPA: RRN7 Zinc-finger of RNA-polymerase I-specific TFIIB, Rrn7 [Caudoviricetes sp.]